MTYYISNIISNRRTGLYPWLRRMPTRSTIYTNMNKSEQKAMSMTDDCAFAFHTALIYSSRGQQALAGQSCLDFSISSSAAPALSRRYKPRKHPLKRSRHSAKVRAANSPAARRRSASSRIASLTSFNASKRTAGRPAGCSAEPSRRARARLISASRCVSRSTSKKSPSSSLGRMVGRTGRANDESDADAASKALGHASRARSSVRAAISASSA